MPRFSSCGPVNKKLHYYVPRHELVDHGQVYALEAKSFVNPSGYKGALRQAARYGEQLGLDEITLAFYVEAIDKANRTRYEAVYEDEEAGVTVTPVFIATGE